MLPILLRAEVDSQVDKSLISAEKAKETKGDRIEILNGHIQVVDRRDRPHNCLGIVSLRWWQVGAACSYNEDFYIVNECGGGLDAILRADLQKNIQDLGDGHPPNSWPLQGPVQKPGRRWFLK